MSDHLKTAIETYNRILPTLLGDQGKFALIHQDRLVGVYAAYEDALSIGYEKFELSPFLVKKIEAVETIHFISRSLLMPCLT